MTFKRIVRELKEIRDGIRGDGKMGNERRHFSYPLGRSHVVPEVSLPSSDFVEQSQWANMPPELLVDIVHRVEAGGLAWPARRDLVACASVCKSWREIMKEVVRLPEECGLLTFPRSLKQPGPKELPIQCFIKRERASSTFLLYLGLSPGEVSKTLLAARKIRRATGTDFVISLHKDDISQASNMYVGKLSSNFLGTKFTIVDKQAALHQRTRILKKKVPQKICGSSCNAATINYELNVLRTRGPRRMNCVMHTIPLSAVQEEGTALTPTAYTNCQASSSPLAESLKGRKPSVPCSPTRHFKPSKTSQCVQEPLILKNKAPRWHEQLQCWCLNFRGRVTVASVKNFQLVASAKPHQSLSPAEQERVILQFGKIGKDIFTMDYRYPLSAFQAFAICLSSFDTKPACE